MGKRECEKGVRGAMHITATPGGWQDSTKRRGPVSLYAMLEGDSNTHEYIILYMKALDIVYLH
jgi:hypothetical protein